MNKNKMKAKNEYITDFEAINREKTTKDAFLEPRAEDDDIILFIHGE